MGTFDIILAALVIFGFIRGLFKGLFVEITSLVALVAGVYGAIHFSYFVSDFLVTKVDWEEKYITVVSFAITFAIIVLAIALLGKMLTKIADFAALGMLNKILGGIFGALKVGLILSVVLIIFGKMNSAIPFITEEQKKESVLFNPIKNLAPMIFPDFFKVTEANKN